MSAILATSDSELESLDPPSLLSSLLLLQMSEWLPLDEFSLSVGFFVGFFVDFFFSESVFVGSSSSEASLDFDESNSTTFITMSSISFFLKA